MEGVLERSQRTCDIYLKEKTKLQEQNNKLKIELASEKRKNSDRLKQIDQYCKETVKLEEEIKEYWKVDEDCGGVAGAGLCGVPNIASHLLECYNDKERIRKLYCERNNERNKLKMELASEKRKNSDRLKQIDEHCNEIVKLKKEKKGIQMELASEKRINSDRLKQIDEHCNEIVERNSTIKKLQEENKKLKKENEELQS